MADEARIGGGSGTTAFPRPLVLAVVVAVIVSTLLTALAPVYAPGLLRLEHAMADVRTALLSDQLPSQHPHVAVVGITDHTLSGSKTILPIDRLLLARLVDALDGAGVKAIGIDVLFYRTVAADDEQALLEAIRRARARIVLAAADDRVGLSQAQIERQAAFLAQAGRPAGYVNLATERDWVVRFKARPHPGSAFPRSFAELLAEAAGAPPREPRRRIAWLREPRDGSDTFLTVPAEALLSTAETPAVKALREALRDKVVILGGLLPDIDLHLTPLTTRTHERTPGAVIHSHMVAELIDGRSVSQLEVGSVVMQLGLAALACFGFLIGWRYRLKRQGILLGSLATVVILAIDTFVFWQSRIILPVVLALAAWFAGEFSGHYLGRWLGHGRSQPMWFGR